MRSQRKTNGSPASYSFSATSRQTNGLIKIETRPSTVSPSSPSDYQTLKNCASSMMPVARKTRTFV